MTRTTLAFLLAALTLVARGEDGYRLWLRYDQIDNATPVSGVILATATGSESPTIAAARAELVEGLGGLTGVEPSIAVERNSAEISGAGSEGYSLRAEAAGIVRISANSDIGALHGAFALLRHIQTGGSLTGLEVTSAPRITHRLLNHWDNLNGTVERGYAGNSLWQWFYLPDIRDSRYRDYARACASIGINGTVITNVNANALVLTPEYLAKTAALAGEFRPYGVRLYLTARFSAPIEIGGLKTADPLDPEVASWWRAKIDEIYTYIPDFGGFIVKANSEGQPGPQDYKRTHADGANMLADALAPHGGVVMWRAFIYAAENTEDRVKQAVTEFAPLDGKFRDNVVIQIKNGPLDFMPREPFSPLFGAMPGTRLAPELQITQEYLGQSTHLAYLAPMWKEVIDADTYVSGEGSTIARVIDGSLSDRSPARERRDSHPAIPPLTRRATQSFIAGVANTGNDRNWTGHHLSQANWYAYGRLAWDHSISSEAIAGEWTRMTFGSDPAVNSTINRMLLGSRETVVRFSMPLGLAHIMAEGHHYGPGPWVDLKGAGRPDWTSVYYHKASESGLGFDRTETGSNALEQYAPEWRALWGDPEKCPENLLLWFHHVSWDRTMKSGRTLWDELCLTYQQGVTEVRALQGQWNSLRGSIDAQRWTEVAQRLERQESDARDWRDACLLYFQQFSKRPLPTGVEKPAHELQYYIDLSANRRFMPGHR
ncbi:MAG TPA: alpha-glucuronidase [Opitutaceae bacterium]|nr:alpha-glucuronidase [Opitutaceae bacterium]